MSRGFRQGVGFARPENALKRADELENVGQKQSALQALHDIITSKKHRTWSKTYENIMFKHIDLVVDMKKRNYGKEALMQYRNMCQQVNINSLEEVIKYYLKKASEKAEEAQAQAAAVTIDVEDLEEDASPEDIMLSYVSGEKSKDRTDRELVTPWFRFLWEAYRSVLEILRTNPKLENLYAMTANKAFQFCLQYKRTAEFRRLCDILRQHLTNLTNRYRDNRELSLDNLQVHLETRFEQLKVACELELWAEAFRSVEDIQALIALAKKQPKQQMMATYYARLTQIFAVSENHLYHAYAWLRLFTFSKSYNKNMTPQDLQMMACSVLLGTLSILPYDRDRTKGEEAQADQEKERILRMANILGFTVDSKKDYRSVLSRQALLAAVSQVNIMGLVPPEVRQIYELLTSDFNPLELCSRLAPLMAKLQEQAAAGMSPASPVKEVALPQYIPSLKAVAVLRLLKQLSEVYSTMKISTLAELVPFATFGEVESILVDAVKFEYLQVRVDHRNGTLVFGSVQLESEKVRGHLALLARRLSKAASMIQPTPSQAHEGRRAAAIKAAMESMETDNRRMAARKIIIEKRKEAEEQALQEQEREAERQKLMAARELEANLLRQRKEEEARREMERLQRELAEKEEEEMRQLVLATKGKIKDGDKKDKKQLMQEAISEKLREQQELERKMIKLARQQDHLERAKREEEAPLIMEAAKKRLEEDRALHEENQRVMLEMHRKAWETDLAEKQRLSSMLPQKDEFQAMIMSRRQEEFLQLQKERERRVKERREQARRERDIKRRKEFVKQAKEQVARKVDELVEEQRLEEEARKLAEAEERQRRLEEAAAKQRAREEEIERRLAEEKAAALASAGPAKYVPPVRSAAPPADSEKPAYRPPVARAEAGAGGSYRPPVARDEPPRSRDEGDRWSRPAPAAGGPPAGDEWRRGPSRDVAGPPRDDGDRWARRDGPPPASRDMPPRRDDGPAPSAGKFVPPSRREGARPSEDSRPPAPSGGSSYRPPNRR